MTSRISYLVKKLSLTFKTHTPEKLKLIHSTNFSGLSSKELQSIKAKLKILTQAIDNELTIRDNSKLIVSTFPLTAKEIYKIQKEIESGKSRI